MGKPSQSDQLPPAIRDHTVLLVTRHVNTPHNNPSQTNWYVIYLT